VINTGAARQRDQRPRRRARRSGGFYRPTAARSRGEHHDQRWHTPGGLAGDNGGNAANINLTTTGGTNNLTVNGTLTSLGGTGTANGTSVREAGGDRCGERRGHGVVKGSTLYVSAGNSSGLNKRDQRRRGRWPGRNPLRDERNQSFTYKDGTRSTSYGERDQRDHYVHAQP